MRKLCLVLSLCLSSLIYAQDVIVLNDGSSIFSKVLEIDASQVKYRKYSNLDGPIYTMNITEILSIKYQNGEVEEFTDRSQQIKQQESISVNSSLTTTTINETNRLRKNKLMKSGESLQGIGDFILGTSLVTGLGFMFASIFTGENSQMITGAALMLGGTAISLPFGITGAIQMRKANEIKIASIYQYDIDFENSTLSPNLNLMSDNINNAPSLGLGVKYTF